MIDIGTEARDLASWPSRERTRALQRILPRDRVEACLGGGRCCPRLPGWFLVWFVVGLGLCGRDSYRQVFPLAPAPGRAGGIPPRSTLCEARKLPGRRPAATPGRGGRPSCSARRGPRAPSTAGCGRWPWTASRSTWPTPRATRGPSAAPARAARRGPSPGPASWPCARPAATSCGGAAGQAVTDDRRGGHGRTACCATCGVDFPTDGGRRVNGLSGSLVLGG